MSISASVTGGDSRRLRSEDDSVRAPADTRCLDAPAAWPAAEAGGDHRHTHLVAHRLVDDSTEDHVRVRVGVPGDDLRRLVHLEQPDIGTARDVEENPGRTVERRLEERRGDGRVGRVCGARVARRGSDSHQRRAGVAHDRADVGEVEVDEPGHGDQVGDALHPLAQDVVGDPERLGHGRLLVDDLEQAVVLDHDERVDAVPQALDADLGLLGTTAAFESERSRDDADRERLELTPELGHDGCGAGAGAATLAGRDEDHVGSLERLLQLVARLRRGGEPDGRIGTGAETAGRLRADVDLDVGVRHQERLCVGVDGDELDAGEAGLDHAVDGIGTAAAHADNLDHREVVATLSVHRFSHLDLPGRQALIELWSCSIRLSEPGYGLLVGIVNGSLKGWSRSAPQPQLES